MIRGTKRCHKKAFNIPAKIHNRFDIEVIDSSTGKVKQRAYAENVICQQYWTYLLTTSSGVYGTWNVFNYIHYGTGTGTPASTDTSLFTYLGALAVDKSLFTYNTNYANGTFSIQGKIVLTDTMAIGATLTEVGVARTSSASSLCTHAMLKDMNGNQISITKTDTDIINVYATIFLHVPAAYLSISGDIVFNLNGYFSRFLCGGYRYENYSTNNAEPPHYYSPGKTNSLPDYMPSENALYLTMSVDVSNKKLIFTAARQAAQKGNTFSSKVKGFGWLCAYTAYENGKVYYPAFALRSTGAWYGGTSIVGEAIGTGDGSTTDFATLFDGAENVTVYVNGIEAQNVTINSGPLLYTDLSCYFRQITEENNVMYSSIGKGLSSSFVTDDSGITNGVWFNPNYAYGVTSFVKSGANGDIEASDDGITWVVISASGTGTGIKTVPVAYQYYKYWKITGMPSQLYYCSSFLPVTALDGKNLKFASAPAPGAVITADYTTPTIAKDANHVFDLTITITLGEYTA